MPGSAAGIASPVSALRLPARTVLSTCTGIQASAVGCWVCKGGLGCTATDRIATSSSLNGWPQNRHMVRRVPAWHQVCLSLTPTRHLEAVHPHLRWHRGSTGASRAFNSP